MKAVARQSQRASIRMPFQTSFLQLAMEFADQGARGFNYGAREVGGVSLAVEELFSFYQNQAASGSMVEIELADQGYRLDLSMTFTAANPDMRPFNLTWRINHDSEESLLTLGPMLAARSVSSLRLEFGTEEQVAIHMTRNKDYPAGEKVLPAMPASVGEVRVVTPSREDFYHFAAMASAVATEPVPAMLACPGMAADMLSAGHVNALLAMSGEWMIGGTVWLPMSEGCLEMFGPYILGGDWADRIQARLMNETISAISRTRYRGLLRRQGSLAGYERFFDYLGKVGGAESQVYYFRHLCEESGAIVYGRGGLSTFLSDQYQRLCLPRQIRDNPLDPARLSAWSVLTVELDYHRSSAILHPLRPGLDMGGNLAGHLKLLAAQGITRILMEINVAKINETAFADALAETGFVPRLLIPDAVLGDIVVYEHAAVEGGA